MYIIKEVGKPKWGFGGEPKTDVYVLLEKDKKQTEIKISYKKTNADFLENKTSAKRAELLLGPDWRNIIMASTIPIKDKFLDKTLIFKNAARHTEKGSITLGWKFELLNKSGGELSDLIQLTPEQQYDVYAGTNLPPEKKNCLVNGKIIQNSGVADYILIDDDVNDAQSVIDKMIPISEHIKNCPKIFFACKALNYRTYKRKYDGDRPLAVQVMWFNDNGKLNYKLQFDKPLECNGDEVADNLLTVLEELGIKTTDDINITNNLCKQIN